MVELADGNRKEKTFWLNSVRMSNLQQKESIVLRLHILRSRVLACLLGFRMVGLIESVSFSNSQSLIPVMIPSRPMVKWAPYLVTTNRVSRVLPAPSIDLNDKKIS